MKAARLLVLGAVLGVANHAALAFQETNSGSTQAGPTPTAPVELGTPPTTGRSTGPEIKIPGLGTIGALPKLDFGLELLYGAQGEQQPIGPRDEKFDSGAQIRGTLKYRFPN